MEDNNVGNRGDAVSQTPPADSESSVKATRSPHKLEKLLVDLQHVLTDLRDRLRSGANIGRVQVVIVDYDTALGLKPDFAEAYLQKGVAESQLGQIQEAIVNYSHTIRLRPLMTIAWINRGGAYAKLEEDDRALADYTEAIRLWPTYGGIYLNRGAINRKLGRLGEALADYDTAIQWLPNLPYAYVNRGSLRLEVGRDDALADYDKAVELDRDNPGIHFARGLANRELSRIDAACSDFETALTLARTVGLTVPEIDLENRLVEEQAANRPRVLTETVDMNSGLIAQIREVLAETCSPEN